MAALLATLIGLLLGWWGGGEAYLVQHLRETVLPGCLPKPQPPCGQFHLRLDLIAFQLPGVRGCIHCEDQGEISS